VSSKFAEILKDVGAGETAPPDYVIGLLAGDEISYVSSLASTEPEKSIFDMGSVTKIIVTTDLIMKAVEEGKITLDTAVHEIFPDHNFRQVTIRQLLNHRSGLREWAPLYAYLESSDLVVDYICTHGFIYEPDKERRYSDFGFILLGKILEKLYAQSLDMLFSHKIARPLHLTQTSFGPLPNTLPIVPSSFGDRAEKEMVRTGKPYPVEEFAHSFDKWRTRTLAGEVNDGNSYHLLGGISGHAGLFSCAEDLMRYLAEILNSLRGEGFFDRVTLNNFLAESRDEQQALGFARYSIPCEGRTVEAYGHTGYPGVAIAFIPELNKGLVMLTNRLLVEGKPIETRRYLLALLQAQVSSQT
jgi:serine-type D-Ala-D-Ala carboxypeptidase